MAKRDWNQRSASERMARQGTATGEIASVSSTLEIEAKLIAFVGGRIGEREKAFATSLLNWIAARGYLTPRQAAAASKMVGGQSRPSLPKPGTANRRNHEDGIVTLASTPVPPYFGTDPPWADG